MDKVSGMGSEHGLFPTTDRTMKYPYTLTAQIKQFPYKWMFKNQWIFRYWIYGCVVSLPVFWKISKMANSPENKKKWADSRAKEAAEAAHH